MLLIGRLVGNELRVWHQFRTDHGQLRKNPLGRATYRIASTKWVGFEPLAVGAVMALMTTLAAERIAEAALELEWGRGVMLAYAKEMVRSRAG